MTRRLAAQTGLSLVEISIIICVMALLTGILAPAGYDLIAQARDVRVIKDGEAIRDALFALLNDTGRTMLRVGGDRGIAVEMLVTDAAAPDGSETDARWLQDADASGRVDLLERHLIWNEPAGHAGFAYRLPTTAGGLGWRGAYLRTGAGADPWGHRYAVNVKYLGGRYDVLVLSAGPNGLVETPFEARNLEFGGDDMATLVR